jgi:hypothetical protein
MLCINKKHAASSIPFVPIEIGQTLQAGQNARSIEKWINRQNIWKNVWMAELKSELSVRMMALVWPGGPQNAGGKDYEEADD